MEKMDGNRMRVERKILSNNKEVKWFKLLMDLNITYLWI